LATLAGAIRTSVAVHLTRSRTSNASAAPKAEPTTTRGDNLVPTLGRPSAAVATVIAALKHCSGRTAAAAARTHRSHRIAAAAALFPDNRISRHAKFAALNAKGAPAAKNRATNAAAVEVATAMKRIN
jgi:hypothetical protein